MKKILKWKWFYIFLVIIIGGGYWFYSYYNSKNKKQTFRTMKIDQGDIAETVTATGNLQAVIQIDVGSQVSGIIQNIYVDFNSQVKKGQLIALIDPSVYQDQVTQARGNYDSAIADVNNAVANLASVKADLVNLQSAILTAKANANKAKTVEDNYLRTYKRYQQLREKDLVSQSDLDGAQTDYDSAVASRSAADAQVASAEAQLETGKAKITSAETQIVSAKASVSRTKAALNQANLNLSYTRIIAPVNGTVIAKNVEVGQTVNASFSAPSLFIIAEDLTQMQVIASIDEADVGKVREDQKVNFTVDAYSDKIFHGIVNQIRSQSSTAQNVITYPGVVNVSNPDLELRPGMTANISFIVSERPGVLRLPNAALRFKMDDDSKSPSTTNNNRSFQGQGQSQGGPGQGGQSQGQGRNPEWKKKKAEGFKHTKVYVLGPDKKTAIPTDCMTGITDGSFTEVFSSKLKAGDEVIVGYSTPDATTAAKSPLNSNPMGGGPRRM